MAAGDVLVQIDDRDYRTSLAQSEARLSEAVASVSNAEAQIAAQQAQVMAAEQQQTEAEAALQFARQEFERAEKLVRTAAGTVQRSQQAQSQLLQAQATASRAKATVEAAKKQIESLQAQKKSAIAGVEGAKADRALAQLNLSYTTIVAAQAGTVVKLSAAKGEYAQAGQNLMMFVPTHIWVTANFKENADHGHASPVSRLQSRLMRIRIVRSRVTSTASSLAREPHSVCCRPKTRRATSSRLSNACLSKSNSTIRLPTSRSVQECRSFRK